MHQVGSNEASWGWCLKTMKIYHDSRKFRHGVPFPRCTSPHHLISPPHHLTSPPVSTSPHHLITCSHFASPHPRDVDSKLRVPDTFYMVLDMDRGTLAFQVTAAHLLA